MKRFSKFIAEKAVGSDPQAFLAMVNAKEMKVHDFRKGINRFHRALLPGEDPKLAGKASIDIFKLMKKQGYRQLTGPGDDILVFTRREELRHKDNTREFITVSVVKDPLTGWSMHKVREDAVRECVGEEYDLLTESIISTIKVYLAGGSYDAKRIAQIFQATWNINKPRDLKKFQKMTNSLANDPKFKMILSQLMTMVGA